MPAAGAPEAVRRLIAEARPDDAQRAMAQALRGTGARTMLLGNTATAHPQSSLLAALAAVIAAASGAVLGLPAGGGEQRRRLAGGRAAAPWSGGGVYRRDRPECPRDAG